MSSAMVLTDYGVKFKMAYFKPESSLNPDSQAFYDSNILTVTRQVKYTTKNENSLDMLLSLNGLPVATIELKNKTINHTVEDAKKQYKFNRDSRDLMFQFKKRELVYFTVNTNEAWMTTKLEGSKAFYLPFIKVLITERAILQTLMDTVQITSGSMCGQKIAGWI